MVQWEGIVFHSALSEGRSGCKLKIDGVRLIATAPEREIELDLRQARLSLGGTANTLLYIRSLQDEPVLTVRDHSILKALQETGIPDMQMEVGTFKKTVWAYRAWLLWSVFACIVLLVGAFGFFSVYGADLVVSVLPYSLDQKMGEAAVDSAMLRIAPQGQYRHPEVVAAVEKIVARLTQAIKPRHFDYSVRVAATDVTNAFALPGGKIVVTTGLIRIVETPEQLAGILAHEIAHVRRRHGLKSIVQSVGTSLLLRAFFGDTSELGEFVIAQARNLEKLRYSRSMESEADRDGFALMQKAGLNPEAMLQFFNRLQSQQQSSIELFSTHPVTSRRIEALRKLPISQTAFSPLGIDWNQVKIALK